MKIGQRALSVEAKTGSVRGDCGTNCLYGCETWDLNATARN